LQSRSSLKVLIHWESSVARDKHATLQDRANLDGRRSSNIVESLPTTAVPAALQQCHTCPMRASRRVDSAVIWSAHRCVMFSCDSEPPAQGRGREVLLLIELRREPRVLAAYLG